MAELLKDQLNAGTLKDFALSIQKVYPDFPSEKFLDSTIDESWKDLELLARGHKITHSLGKYLPSNYQSALKIIDKVIINCPGFYAWTFLDFIEVYGQDEENWDLSIAAMERYTSYASAELAVRRFIIKDEKRMMAQMYKWSKAENEHLRRLSSEGCRPALPWAIALKSFKKDPAMILPILTQLKADPSLYVRKSVANNLNDISKTHPDLVIELAKSWYGDNEFTNWIVKHGCRTLLKKGNPQALAIFGIKDTDFVVVTKFSLNKATVYIGEDIIFSFDLTAHQATKVRLEYEIAFVKSNGQISKKVFQISETHFNKDEQKHYSKKHSFADLSTRKHYPGKHIISLIVNGVSKKELSIEVLKR